MAEHQNSNHGDHGEMTFANTPNMLTLLRMLFVPVVVAFLALRTPSSDLTAAILFTIASITDFFDGYLARRRKSVTVYGKLMDPLADKFLIVSALVTLQQLGRIHFVVVILLICREMAITGLRALASAEGLIIAASRSAKWKTATQMVAIPFIMLKPGLFGIPLYWVGTVLLYISLGISLWSAKDYIIDFFRALAEKRKLALQTRRERRETRIAARAARRAAKAAKKAAAAERSQQRMAQSNAAPAGNRD